MAIRFPFCASISSFPYGAILITISINITPVLIMSWKVAPPNPLTSLGQNSEIAFGVVTCIIPDPMPYKKRAKKKEGREELYKRIFINDPMIMNKFERSKHLCLPIC